jgi:galactonate dehydratase
VSHRVAGVESFVLTLPRDDPYLGPLGPEEAVNAKGYFVRSSNRTVYPTFDRSVLVRVTSAEGAEGWGETYGLVAPGATTAIIDDLLADFVVGRDPFEAAAIHDDLYDLMRVRGYTGGFYLDALAAVDIALRDLAGQLSGRPLADLLGGRRRTSIPAYVSGLPAATLAERVAIASRWCARGFDAVKFADAVADSGPVTELSALRRELGAAVRIGVDLHWRYQPAEAIRVIREMEPYDPWFAEAPVAPEDVAAQAEVARAVGTPIALGEEWRTAYDAKLRFERGCPAIVQPEMGHTGPTEFLRIAALAHAEGITVMPHATIGAGIFLAASLHAAAAIDALGSHEFQHSILLQHRGLLDGPLECAEGAYTLPPGPGLGVRPGAEVRHMIGLQP